MKILFYFWAPYYDQFRRGGGIRIYQENLLREATRRGEHTCVFLCAGLTYSFDNKPRIEAVNNESLLCSSYELVNSPVMAPAAMQFENLATYLSDETLIPVLNQFWKDQGGFDVFHIQSMEGLPLSALRIKEFHPETKIVFSIHNYNMFCPQVNLWSRERKNCFREPDFPNCSGCKDNQKLMQTKLVASVKYAMGSVSDIQGNFRNNALFRLGHMVNRQLKNIQYAYGARMAGRSEKPECNADLYREYRIRNVEALNRYCDAVLAVSQRVRDICVQFGVRKDKLRVEYIGTRFAEMTRPMKPLPVPGRLKLAYMGYARRDKGFYFLLDSILNSKSAVWSHIDLLLAARTDDSEERRQIQKLENCVHSLEHVNGYTANQLPDLLKDVNLGIVPVLWEDNLPQVSMELKSFGIPVMASDAGGAQELSACPELVFRAGNAADLEEKLGRIIERPEILDSYWKNEMPLPTMQQHWDALLRIYQGNAQENLAEEDVD